MSRFLEHLTAACQQSYHTQIGGPLLTFVTKGDAKALEQAKKAAGKNSYGMYFLWEVWSHLAPPGQLSVEEKRAMQGAAELGAVDRLVCWIAERVQKDPAEEEDCLTAFLEAFGRSSEGRIRAAAGLAAHKPPLLLRSDGTATAAGKFLLTLSAAELKEVVAKVDEAALLEFLLIHAPSRVPPLAQAALVRPSDYGPYTDANSCGLLLKYDAPRYEKDVAAAFFAEKKLGPKFHAGVHLTRLNRDKYQSATHETARAMLADDNWSGNSEEICRWLVEQFQIGALADIEAYLRRHGNFYCTEKVLKNAQAAFGDAAWPAVIASLENPSAKLRLMALEQRLTRRREEDRERILAGFLRGLADEEPATVIAFVALAGRFAVGGLEQSLWDLLNHKSKPVRQAAARALGKHGDASVTKAAELLTAKKASVRSAAVTILATAQTPAAAKALESRLDEETDDEVRDEMLLALDRVWAAQGKKVTRGDIERRIERAADKLKSPVAPWVNEKKLPPLHFAGKKKDVLSQEAVRYLLYRQSRAKEIRADVEARPLFEMIDRGTSGDFALALLQMYCGSKMAAEDRWALSVAGLLGDDRVVPVLMQQIRKWVEGSRGKLAEYAAQALALLGSDVALCSVDSLSIRYRSKQKNIGKAASEAFAEAAERLGISVDELGDRVVPWLGFEEGKPRVIEQKDKRIEVRIGSDFKLEFRDLVKGKAIASLPAGIPAEIKNEFKDLAATLREVVKGQLVRLENLMVRQFRWPIGRWQELYLQHPVLFPFATRLAWGLYGEGGKLLATFRALEDRTLTSEQDETVELPAEGDGKGTIGILHPLELSSEQRQAWLTHLADYNVVSPFLQMERPVIFPAADEKETRISTKLDGTEVNAMTFKGRAERLGWQRGSVVDGGGISSYRKCFPGAGADANLELDGLYIGIDMYSSIKLRRFYFVKSGSVSFGSYEYDEPQNEQDERVIPFGRVPPIVFSETLGDLERIAGKKQAEGEEE